MIIEAYIQPGSKKSAYAGEFDGRIKIKIAAPPVDGAANKAVVKFFSSKLKCSKSAVSILKGELSRYKTISIDTDLSPEEALKLLSE